MYSENYRNDNSLHIDIETQENDQNNFFGIFEMVNESNDEDELEEYLRKPVVNFKSDLLQWWKISKFIGGFSLMKFN